MSRIPTRVGLTPALLLSSLSLVVGSSVTPAAAATTSQVTSCDQISLTNAINAAGPGGTVQFAIDCPSSAPLRIAGRGAGIDDGAGTITLSADVTIDGNGHDVEMGYGSGDRSRFVVNEGVDATFKGVTIAESAVVFSGFPPPGQEWQGGAINNHGRLTVIDSTFRNNYTHDQIGRGGAIANDGGQLFVVRSSFIDNRATRTTGSCDGCRTPGGGAIINSGAGTLNVTESTFRGNRSATVGGAIFGEGSHMTVTKSTFSDNGVDGASFFGGGAIASVTGDLTVTDSTFSGNSTVAAAGAGGAIDFERLGAEEGTLTVSNSTFSGNTSPPGGSAIWSRAPGAISNSTFQDNSSVEGGAVHGEERLAIRNSIFSGNTSVEADWRGLASGIAPYPRYFCDGPCIMLGPIVTGSLLAGNSYPSCRLASDNLASGTLADDSSCTGTATGGLAGSLNLGRLADNGGPTRTIALKPGSVAIDYPHASCLQPADQRSFRRDAKCDPGAYEAGSTGTAPLPSCDLSGLYAALHNVGRGGTVRIMDDCSIIVWEPVLLAQDITIDGNGHRVTLSGDDAAPVLQVGSGVTATLNDLTITKGRASSTVPAGGILNFGKLTVTNSTFSNNVCSCPGGGGITNNTSAVLNVSNSTFTNNSGGGIGNAGTLSVTNSTFSSNPGVGGGISNVTGDGVATLTNNVFGGNGSACRNAPGGAFIDRGGNLADDTSCGFVATGSTNGATGLQLGPLADNGGPTPTVALLAGSTAIDAARADCPTSDQRHFVRGGAGQTTCDSGAFEFQVLVVKDLPANITTNATSAAGAAVSYTPPTAEGGSQPAVTCTPGSGSTFPIGVTDVTCTATSRFTTPLTVSQSFTVTVLDRTLSFVALPTLRVTADTPHGALVHYGAPTVVNLQGQPVTTATVSCSPASGTIFPFGFTTVSCTATESAYGNSPISTSFGVFVDRPKPVITGADPAARPAGSGASTVTLTGTGFIDESTVYLYPMSTGAAVRLTTRVESFTRISADVPADLPGGTALLSVKNRTGSIGVDAFVSNTWPWLVTDSEALAAPFVMARGVDPSATTGGSGPSTAGSVTVSGASVDRSCRTVVGGAVLWVPCPPSGTLGVAKYRSNPVGALADGTDRYFNALVVNRAFPKLGQDLEDPTTNCFVADPGREADSCTTADPAFSNVTIVACDLNGGKVVQWWTGTEWLRASHQSYDAATGCVTITVGVVNSEPTKPSLDQVAGTPFGVVALDNPLLQSISLADVDPTGARSVGFTVTFDEAVSGVTADNFTLTTTGVSGASIASVSGSGATRTVSVNTGTGDGTIRLDMTKGTSVVDAAGHTLDSTNLPFAGPAYTVDKTPETAIGNTPPNPNSDAWARFTFSGPDGDGNRFECQVDAGFVPCTSPVGYHNLGGGSHTFQVRAIDRWGNVGAPASFTWTADSRVPAITGTNPSTGSAGGAASTLTLTGTGFAADSNVYLYPVASGVGMKLKTQVVSSTEVTADLPADLTDGFAMLTVKNGGAGDFACCGTSSNHWPWLIMGGAGTLAGAPSSATDTDPGVTMGGNGSSTAGSVTISGTLKDDLCSVDGALLRCHPYGTLGMARYASNPAGSLPASSGAYFHAFVVRGFPESPSGAAYSPMDCFTAFGIGGNLCGRERASAFPTVTIVHCDLKGGNQVQWWTGTEWRPASHQTYNKDTDCVTITVGSVDWSPTSPSLEQLARAPLGVTSTTPVDSTPPETTITDAPSNPPNSTDAAFSFTGDGTGSAVAGFECKLDTGDFSPCASPTGYTGLDEGSHIFQVRAIDAAGNVDPTPASFTWTTTVDTDGDGVENNADADDDDDGVADVSDAFPLNPAESLDSDGDEVGNNADADDDDDGVADVSDAFPVNPAESVDTDGDGTGDNADQDDDGDGVADESDAFPLNPSESVDTDGDGTGNGADRDDDGDGVADAADAFPLNANESADTDGDGTGNNADTDDDGDGVNDADDAFPLDPNESVDTDGDGTGNNADNCVTVPNGDQADVDRDGLGDACDNAPPVAVDDIVTTAEDTATTINVAGNDTDVDGDVLRASSVSAPAHGTATVVASGPEAGKVVYTPAANYTGQDTFTYKANDGELDSANTATVTITVPPVNDAPSVSSDRGPQTVQYSDPITNVTITASDVDSAPTALVASTMWKKSSDASFAASTAPLGGLSLVPVSPTTATPRTWSLQGRAMVPAGTYTVRVTVTDGQDPAFPDVTIIVGQEDAAIEYSGDSLVVTPTATASSAATVNVAAVIREATDGSAGDKLDTTQLKFTLYRFTDTTMTTPVTSCTGSVSSIAGQPGAGMASCTASPTADIYTVKVEVLANGYYVAPVENQAVTVVNPGTGFTTGGGSLNEPNLGSRSNFGFTVKYLKSGTVQGNSLYIYRVTLAAGNSHGLPAGNYNWIIKSNAMTALTQKCTTTAPVVCTASFGGKNTITAVNRATGVATSLGGNYQFQVDVTDNSEPGSSPGAGPDTYAIKVWDSTTPTYYQLGKPTSQVKINGGSIQVEP